MSYSTNTLDLDLPSPAHFRPDPVCWPISFSVSLPLTALSKTIQFLYHSSFSLLRSSRIQAVSFSRMRASTILAIFRADSGVAPDFRQETTTLRPSCPHVDNCAVSPLPTPLNQTRTVGYLRPVNSLYNRFVPKVCLDDNDGMPALVNRLNG